MSGISTPPASTKSQSPSRIMRAPMPMAWLPEAHAPWGENMGPVNPSSIPALPAAHWRRDSAADRGSPSDGRALADYQPPCGRHQLPLMAEPMRHAVRGPVSLFISSPACCKRLLAHGHGEHHKSGIPVIDFFFAGKIKALAGSSPVSRPPRWHADSTSQRVTLRNPASPFTARCQVCGKVQPQRRCRSVADHKYASVLWCFHEVLCIAVFLNQENVGCALRTAD